jgi:hypothetical protein
MVSKCNTCCILMCIILRISMVDNLSDRLESPSIMKKPCQCPLIVRLLSGAELVFLHVAEIL